MKKKNINILCVPFKLKHVGVQKMFLVILCFITDLKGKLTEHKTSKPGLDFDCINSHNMRKYLGVGSIQNKTSFVLGRTFGVSV